jgi:hypothetical protein
MSTAEIDWLLKQIGMDEQSARAMPHAIEHLESRWAPAKLIADCEAKRRIAIRHAPVADSEHGDGLYCRCCGYGGELPEKWPCDTFRDVASAYAAKPGFPEILRRP